MATRYVSDSTRANLSSLFSVIPGIGLAVWVVAGGGDLGNIDRVSFITTVYLFTWPLFGAIYLGWTHLAYAKQGPRTLGSRARRESASRKKWWAFFTSYGGASSWTMTAALATVFITVVIAQNPDYRNDLFFVALGLLCVATSWALMVYAFALQYLLLDEGDGETEHISMGLDTHARFGDYLTLAVLLSTMAATVSARIRTRQAWTLVRTNVLFAFAFNSVIVAMVVSLLLGGLLG